MKENRYTTESHEQRMRERKLALQKAQARKVKEQLRTSDK